RSTHRSGDSGSTSTSTGLPFTTSLTVGSPQREARSELRSHAAELAGIAERKQAVHLEIEDDRSPVEQVHADAAVAEPPRAGRARPQAADIGIEIRDQPLARRVALERHLNAAAIHRHRAGAHLGRAQRTDVESQLALARAERRRVIRPRARELDALVEPRA